MTRTTSSYLSSPTSPTSKRTSLRIAGTTAWELHSLHAGTANRSALFIHGGGAWAYSFRHLLADPRLTAQRRLHAIDMPGHGWTKLDYKSPAPAFDISSMVATILAYLDASCGLEPVDLVGNSWGGGWCLAFAQRYPHRVRSLVLISSSGFPGREVFLYESLKWPIWGELTAQFVSRSIAARFYRQAFFNPAAVTDEMIEEAYRPMAASRFNRMAQVRLMRRLDWTSVEAKIPQTRISSLVIWGDSDRLWPVQMAHRFHKHLPDSELYIVKHCGHLPHEERPKETADRIAAFWNRAD